MDKREQAKKECHEQAMAKFRVGNEDLTPVIQAARFGFECGFDAGHAAADDWVAIEGNAENLPKDAGRYLFRDILGNAKTEVFDFQDWNMLNDITKGFFLSLYVAWMPIPEYQRPTDEERNK